MLSQQKKNEPKKTGLLAEGCSTKRKEQRKLENMRKKQTIDGTQNRSRPKQKETNSSKKFVKSKRNDFLKGQDNCGKNDKGSKV